MAESAAAITGQCASAATALRILWRSSDDADTPSVTGSPPDRSTLAIFGCGGLGLELLSYLIAMRDEPRGSGTSYLFVDDRADGGRIADASRMLGRPCRHVTDLNDVPIQTPCLIAAGAPAARHSLLQRCRARGLTPHTLIHPTALVDPSAEIGAGAIVAPFAFVGHHARVGANAVVNIYASVGHDASVGDSSVLGPYATLNGDAHCGNVSFLGSGSVVTSGHRLGDHSKLSAGSVLTLDTAAGALATGNPARHRVLFAVPNEESAAHAGG